MAQHGADAGGRGDVNLRVLREDIGQQGRAAARQPGEEMNGL